MVGVILISRFEIEMIYFFFFLRPICQIFVTSSHILGNYLLTGCIFHLLGSQNMELRPGWYPDITNSHFVTFNLIYWWLKYVSITEASRSVLWHYLEPVNALWVNTLNILMIIYICSYGIIVLCLENYSAELDLFFCLSSTHYIG